MRKISKTHFPSSMSSHTVVRTLEEKPPPHDILHPAHPPPQPTEQKHQRRRRRKQRPSPAAAGASLPLFLSPEGKAGGPFSPRPDFKNRELFSPFLPQLLYLRGHHLLGRDALVHLAHLERHQRLQQARAVVAAREPAVLEHLLRDLAVELGAGVAQVRLDVDELLLSFDRLSLGCQCCLVSGEDGGGGERFGEFFFLFRRRFVSIVSSSGLFLRKRERTSSLSNWPSISSTLTSWP